MIGLLFRWATGNVVPAAVIAAGVAGFAYVGWLKWSIADLEADLATESARRMALESQVVTLKFENALKDAATAELEATLKDSARLDAESATRLKEVDDAPEADDGPVSPVLRRALDGLR